MHQKCLEMHQKCLEIPDKCLVCFLVIVTLQHLFMVYC